MDIDGLTRAPGENPVGARSQEEQGARRSQEGEPKEQLGAKNHEAGPIPSSWLLLAAPGYSWLHLALSVSWLLLQGSTATPPC